MITRSDWGARAPKGRNPIGDKSGGIVIHYTATASPRTHWPDCWQRWRAHQNYHMDTQGWLDIAYNHLVCAHGFHFEGRGWDSQNGANKPENSRTVSICWEGGPSDIPDQAVVERINDLIAEAVTRGWARIVRPHSSVSATGTQCPGNLRPLIADGRIGISAPQTPPPVGTTGTPVMGNAQVSLGQAVEFVTQRATGAAYPIDTVKKIVETTWQVADADGVRADLAIGLMAKETGFFRYGGDVQADQWNFGGIGATGGVPGVRFLTLEAGVKAVVRRMRMYAVHDRAAYDPIILGRGLSEIGVPLDQPGFHGWGKHPNIEDFNGAWAVPGVGYGQSIVAMVETMKTVPVPSEPSHPFTDSEVSWLDNRYVRG
jgi:hypothetical protein